MPTALVTGATSGIGAEFAAQLAERGDDLVLVARDAGRLEETATTLRDRHGTDVEVLAADLAKAEDTRRVAARLAEADRPVDLLVNNAGFGMHTRLLDEGMDTEIDTALAVMARAVVVLGGTAGRAMRARGRGGIVNVSSTAGWVYLGAYSAVKAFVTTYTEGLALELRGSGVTATVLCPGWVRTEFHERAGLRTSRIPGPAWVDNDRLVHDCLADVDHGRVLSIPTKRWRVAIALAEHAPRAALRSVSVKLRSER
jgi:short-subunit dehydrogenase